MSLMPGLPQLRALPSAIGYGEHAHGCRIGAQKGRFLGSMLQRTDHRDVLVEGFVPVANRTVTDEPFCDRALSGMAAALLFPASATRTRLRYRAR
jgi:hypothetical protein